jgi:hypothetical protein
LGNLELKNNKKRLSMPLERISDMGQGEKFFPLPHFMPDYAIFLQWH